MGIYTGAMANGRPSTPGSDGMADGLGAVGQLEQGCGGGGRCGSAASVRRPQTLEFLLSSGRTSKHFPSESATHAYSAD